MPVIKTIYGQLTTPDWPDDLIVRTLVTYGEWSLAEQMLLAPMVRGDDCFWDVGAFLGTFGLGVSHLAAQPPRDLVVVEPSSVLQHHLRENLTRNAPCPFQIAPFAVANHVGLLSPREDQSPLNAGGVKYEHAVGIEATVACRPLKDLRAEYGDYDVLKLDIEGMENEAILSDREYIQTKRPIIWAECNEDTSSIDLLETLIELNYNPIYVAFPFFRKNNYNATSARIFPMAYEAVLLAAPPDRLADFTGKVDGEEIIVRPVNNADELRQALWSTPRWALSDWVCLSKAELIARLGRASQSQLFETFLIRDNIEL